MFAVFGLVASALVAALHYYLWTRLVRDPRMPAPYDKAATAALVLLALVIPATMMLTRLVSATAARGLAWTAFTWMGVMFILFMVLLAVAETRRVSIMVAGMTSARRTSAAVAALS